jgi:type I restriction enzyme S subunit
MNNKVAPKTMKQNGKRELRPTMRFPEFRDAPGWTETKLADVLTEHGLKNDGNCKVHSVSVHKGIVDQIEHLGRSYAAADTSNYNLVRPHDIVYTKSPTGDFPLGIMKQSMHPYSVSVSPLYGVVSPINRQLGYILDAYFESPIRTRNYLAPITQKGAKNTIQISNQTFLPKGLYLPSDVREHQQIAECLTSLDELIAAHGQKLDALKAHRKGLMRQLFPRDGETIPHLRFPEFQDSPEWISDSLGNIFETSSGGTPERSVKEYWNGRIPWITTSLVDFNVICNSDEFISELGLRNSSAKVFQKKTVLIAMYGQGKTRGKVALLGIEATTNQACAAILPREGIDPYFVFLNLAGRYDEMRALSNSGGQENLSQGLIKGLPFSYPNAIAEQQNLSACLSSFDELITAQTEKLEALKTHKKGLMQQLFPSPEEVEA